MTAAQEREKCETCRFHREIPKWRKRQRTSPLEATAKVVECVRYPLPVVKLATEWCGDHMPGAGDGG